MSAELDPIFGCELATGRLDREGYAYHGRTRGHIAAWVEARGSIPPDREIDHLCRRRHCRALHHLELVTRSENERRKDWAYRQRRERCPAGHDLRLYRQITPERGIVCRLCNREHHQGRPR